MPLLQPQRPFPTHARGCKVTQHTPPEPVQGASPLPKRATAQQHGNKQANAKHRSQAWRSPHPGEGADALRAAGSSG